MRISMVMSTLNPVPKWITKALISAEPFDEIILHIDASTKNKFQIPNLGEKIKVIYCHQHLEITEALNYASSFATGDFISFFCDDDEYHKKNLTNLLFKVKKGFFNGAHIISVRAVVYENSWKFWKRGLCGAEEDFTLEEILQENKIAFSSLIQKDILKKLGGFQIPAVNDWDLWCRAKKANCFFKYYPEIIYYNRLGTTRSSFKKQTLEYGIDGLQKLVSNNVKRFNPPQLS